MFVAHTSSAEETQALAAQLASLLTAGDLIVMSGDLGAGKTAFTQGLGAALGVDEPITSPTFTLVQEYVGNSLRIYHLDVYRLEQLAEVADLGLAEMLDDEAVTIIEWGDAISSVLPNDRLELTITLGEADDDRVIHAAVSGTSWTARCSALVRSTNFEEKSC